MSQNFGVRSLAREVGFSAAYVSRCMAKGETVDQIRQRAARKTAQLANVPATRRGKSNETFSSAQTRKEIALADQREMENAQRRGELVNRAQISNFLAAAILSSKDVILRLSEFADRWSAETDPYTIRQDIERECYRALGELEAAWLKLTVDSVEPEPDAEPPEPEPIADAEPDRPALGSSRKSAKKAAAKGR